ncbi:hypothetical protein VNO78_01554 [Psophocarpus tetragonolobus]|uniref:Uncharacterized protein n=1 Tax=Psophocarpus tetragonolobus TaxID=3891 RepID=A0AAN9SZ63_PSOTE
MNIKDFVLLGRTTITCKLLWSVGCGNSETTDIVVGWWLFIFLLENVDTHTCSAMVKTRQFPFRWLLVLVLALHCAGQESSTPTPTPTPTTIIFNTVGRVYYTFDIYSLPIQQEPLTSHQELRLTDGHSVNYNGHFLSNTSVITASPPLQLQLQLELVYVTERDGFPTIYYDAVYASSQTTAATRRSALETPIAHRIQKPLLGNTKISMKDKPNLTPDGEYLVYVSTHEDPGIPHASWAAVYSTHLQSGLTQRLTPYGVSDFSPALSPSATWTAVASYGSPGPWTGEVEDFPTDIYVFLTRDGTQRLKIAQHGGWPAWVDDRTLYFHRRGQDRWWSIYKATLPSNAFDSVLVERVTPPGVHGFTPATSPGNYDFIAVATRRPGSSYRHIELFDLVHKQFRELTGLVSPGAHHFNPFMSPDSSRVGYHRCRGEEPLILENVGSPVEGLSLFRFAGEFPSFSPSGDRIAYTSQQGGVHVVNSDGSKLRKVSNAMSFTTAWDPVRPGVLYTARGKTFGSESSRVDIVSVNMEEENSVKRLTAKGSNNAFPSVSPDGKWIVFRSGRSGLNNLYIMDAVEGEKKEVRRLTEGAWNDTMCQWSPDGEWIVFASNRHKPDTPSFELYLIHPNGTGLRKLVESRYGGRANHPCFSPDGKSVAFATDYAGVSAEPISNPDNPLPYGEIFTVRLDGSGIKRITHNSHEDGTPAWSPHPLHNLHRPNPGPFCHFIDCSFLNIIPNSTRLPSLSNPPHCVINK